MISQISSINDDKINTNVKTIGVPYKANSFSVGVVMLNLLVFLFVFAAPFTSPDTLALKALYVPDLLYYLKPNDNMSTFFYALVIQAMATAVFQFGFMLNRRASTAYLSLPVSRDRHFWSRYSAGLLLLLLPHVINFTWLLYANIAGIGYSPQLMQAYAVMLSATMVALALMYGVTSAVLLCVGTLPEGVVFSLLIMFGVLFIPSFATNIFSVFLHGNAMGESYSVYTQLVVGYSDSFATNYPTVSSFMVLDRSAEYSGPLEEFVIDGSVDVLVSAAVAVGIAFLGRLAFKRYKAENSGSLGINPILNCFGTFVIVFMAFCIGCSVAADSVRLAAGLALSLAAFVLCRFLLTINLKRTFEPKGFKMYGAILGVIALICVSSLTGLFGYSAWQPDIDQIENAYIAYTGAPDFIPGISDSEFGNYHIREDTEEDIVVRDYFDLEFTSEEDIRTVLGLHKELIDAGSAGIKTKVYVRYGLKNGKVIDRLYKSIPADIAVDLLRLDGTDALKARFAEATVLPDSETHHISVTDAFFQNEYNPEPADKSELLAALQKDIDSMGPDEKYFPETLARAVISIPRVSSEEAAGVSIYNGGLSDGAYVFSVTTGMFDSSIPWFTPSTDTMRFFITDSYINTISFLKEKDVWEGVSTDDTGGIEEMYLERHQLRPRYDSQALYFRSYASKDYSPRPGAMEVDQGDYSRIMRLARSNYYVADGGYLVKVKTTGADGSQLWTTLFLPEADAPEYAKGL